MDHDAPRPRVMGLAEIAARLRLGIDRTKQLVDRRDFPEPLAELAMGRVWLAGDVDAWVRNFRPYLDEPEDP